MQTIQCHVGPFAGASIPNVNDATPPPFPSLFPPSRLPFPSLPLSLPHYPFSPSPLSPPQARIQKCGLGGRVPKAP